MNYNETKALEYLRKGSGNPAATFRAGQQAAIKYVVEGQGRLLVVQKTGWGKSFVYFIATRLLRDAGMGPVLLVSPLLALMRNQIDAAQRMGVCAETINSDNHAQWDQIEQRLASDQVDILLISPERLGNERFRERVLGAVAGRIAMLVVDEAHCISDWGHDFRPHYRLIERMMRRMAPNMRLLATTATANTRVMRDLMSVLGPDMKVSRGPLGRDSLTLQTINLPNQAERMAWLADTLSTLSGHGIIYALTVRDAHRLAEWLKSKGHVVEAYTGQSEDKRPELEQALINNQVKALVATSALGMGYDKPDLGFVIHYQMPGSVVAYYQQVGRAGRALDSAYGILLGGTEDIRINDWFINSAFPSRAEVQQILALLDSHPDGLSLPQILSELNLRKGRVEKALQLMSLELPAPIAKVGSKWQLTVEDLKPDFWERAARLTALRRAELTQMQDYLELPFGKHMNYLIEKLDGQPSSEPPRLPPLSEALNNETVREAEAWLRRSHLPIEPRKVWPAGGLSEYGVSGKIPERLRPKSGMALCYWGDAGWGRPVREGKYKLNQFSRDLVEAMVKMVREWNPQPKPQWVTCVPSLRHPRLVPDFAAAVAAALGLPFHPLLQCVRERPEQKTMQNSQQQALNLNGAFKISGETVPKAPVFLIDDMVDSRWTLTVAAWLLLRHGSGPVLPVCLSQSGADE